MATALEESIVTISGVLDKHMASIDALGTRMTGFEAVLASLKEGNKPEAKSTSIAKMEERGVLAGITEMKVWNIPVGQAVVGGFVAVFATEVIDGFLATQGPVVRGVIKLGAAGAAVWWGKGIFGDTGSKAIAILLTVAGIRDFVPIDLWAQRASGMVSGVVTQRGLVQGHKVGASNPVVQQAEEVARIAQTSPSLYAF